MRKTNEQKIGVVIKNLLKNQKLKGRLEELDLIDKCKEMLGENLMKFIKDIAINDGRLIIQVSSAVVRNELSYQKSKIRKKINDQSKSEIIKQIILK